VEGLRVELGGEALDLLGIDRMPGALEPLPDRQVVKV
jgi:hypothetical protein